MSKKIARVVSIAMCTLMLASSVACGSKDTDAEKSTTTTTSAATGSTAAEKADPFGKYPETVTLSTVRVLDSNVKFDTTKPEAKSLTENAWASAYEDQLGIKFDYLWTTTLDQYPAKWNVAIASGDIPDAAVVNGTIYKQLVAADLIEDMTSYFNDYASDVYKQDNIADNGNTMGYMTYDGKLLGLPQDGTQPDALNLTFIRKDWLAKVNMSEPKTIDELIAVAKAFVDAKLGGANTYGLNGTKDPASFAGFYNAFGANYNIWQKDSGSDSLVFGTIQPEMKTALLKLQQMYKDGLIAQDFAVKEGSVATQDVAASKVGIFYGSFADPLVGIKDNYANNKSAEWAIMTPPSADGSKFISQATATPADFIFVKKGCKNPEAVVKVVNLNFKLQDTDPEHYGTGADGIEKHKYRFGCEMAHPWKNLEAYKAVSAAITSKDASKLNGEQKGYYDKIVAGDKPFAGVFGTYSTFKFISDMKDNDQILVDAYQSLPTDTYVAKGETIKVSLDAAILKVIMGDDINNYDKAVDAWKKGGGDTITKEVNEWYAKNKK